METGGQDEMLLTSFSTLENHPFLCRHAISIDICISDFMLINSNVARNEFCNEQKNFVEKNYTMRSICHGFLAFGISAFQRFNYCQSAFDFVDSFCLDKYKYIHLRRISKNCGEFVERFNNWNTSVEHTMDAHIIASALQHSLARISIEICIFLVKKNGTLFEYGLLFVWKVIPKILKSKRIILHGIMFICMKLPNKRMYWPTSM